MQPIRVSERNLVPGERFWNFRDAAKSESGETEVEFFGPISEESWFGDEVTPLAFKQQLYDAGKGQAITVKVNSPGGDVFAAAAIRSILQDYPGHVTADIVGLAASAATVVVTGADKVRMRDTAMFMIHDPSTIAWGTIDEMKQVVTVLEQVKETILNGYQAKTGKERAELARMMSAETWMTAQQAADFGFVDEVVSEGKKVKMPKVVRAMFLNCLEDYQNVPEAVSGPLSAFSEEEESEEVITIEDAPIVSEIDNEAAAEISALKERVGLILGRKS